MNIVGSNLSERCKIQCGFSNDVVENDSVLQVHTPDVELRRSVIIYNSNWKLYAWSMSIDNQHTIIDIMDNGDNLPYKIKDSGGSVGSVVIGDGSSSELTKLEGIVTCYGAWSDGLFSPKTPDNANGLDVEAMELGKQIVYPVFLWHTSSCSNQNAKSPNGKWYSTYDKKVFLYIEEASRGRRNKREIRIVNSKIYNCESSGSARFYINNNTILVSGKTDIAINNQSELRKLTSQTINKEYTSGNNTDVDFSGYKGWRKPLYWNGELKYMKIDDTKDIGKYTCKQLVKIKYDTSSSLFMQPESGYELNSTNRVLIYNNEEAGDDEIKTLVFYQYGNTQLNPTDRDIIIGCLGGYYDKWDTLHSSTPLSEKQRVVDVLRYEAYSRAVPFGRNDAFISAEETNKYATPQTFNTYCNAYEKYESFIPYNVGIPCDITQNAYIYMSEENNFSEYDSDMYCANISNSIGTDAIYGKLLGVVECCGTLYCVQETAVSALDYNKRRVNNDLGGYRSSDIQRGDYDYKIKNEKINSMASVCATEFGLAVLAHNNTVLYLIAGDTVIDMTRQYGMQKYFKNKMSNAYTNGRYNNVGVRLLYDEIKKKLFITNITTSLTFDFTINAFTGEMPYHNISAIFKSSTNIKGGVAIKYPDSIYELAVSDNAVDGTPIQYVDSTCLPYIDLFVKCPTLDSFAQYHNVEVEAVSIQKNTLSNHYTKSKDFSDLYLTDVDDVDKYGVITGQKVNVTGEVVGQFEVAKLKEQSLYASVPVNPNSSYKKVWSGLIRADSEMDISIYSISCTEDGTESGIIEEDTLETFRVTKQWRRYSFVVEVGAGVDVCFIGVGKKNKSVGGYFYLAAPALYETTNINTEGLYDWSPNTQGLVNDADNSFCIYKQLDCPIKAISVWNDYGTGSAFVDRSNSKLPIAEDASIVKRNGRWIISMPRFVANGNAGSFDEQRKDSTSLFDRRNRIGKRSTEVVSSSIKTTCDNQYDRPYGNSLWVRITFVNDAFVRVRRLSVGYDIKQL